MKFLQRWLVSVMSVAALLVARPAAADRIVIIGSDAATFHRYGPFAADLRDYLRNGSALPVLLLGDALATSAFMEAVSSTGVVATSSLSLVTLSPSRYGALLVLSASANGAGCCNSDDGRVSGFQTEISEFVTGGGTLGIQNYIGGAAYDSLLGTTGGANDHVWGHLGGLGGTANYDDEAVTAAGMAAGFANYPVIQTWGHQGYDLNFFGQLGFNSLIDAPSYGTHVSGLMSTGDAAVVPEPSTLLLFGSGVAGLISRARRRGTRPVL